MLRLWGVKTPPYPATNPTACRAAVLLHQAAEDAGPAEMATGLSLPEFFFAYERPPVLEPTYDLDAWRAAERTIDGLVAYPAHMLARPDGWHWDTHPGER